MFAELQVPACQGVIRNLIFKFIGRVATVLQMYWSILLLVLHVVFFPYECIGTKVYVVSLKMCNLSNSAQIVPVDSTTSAIVY